MKRIKRVLLQIGYRLLTLVWLVYKPDIHGVKSLIWCDEKILLVRHSYGNTLWKVPGGLLKRKENRVEAITREVHEELNVHLTDVVEIGAYGSTKEHPGENVTCFSAQAKTCTFTIDGVEIREADWFHPSRLPDNRARQVDDILGMFRKTHIER